MTSIAIVDSGPLVAVANSADRDHEACLEVMSTSSLRFVVPILCVTEAAYLIQRSRGPTLESRFLIGLEGFDVLAPEPEDWRRIGDLVAKYADLPLGAVDASVVALSEHLLVDTIVTLDRRHFSVVRPVHVESFHLLP